MKLNKILKTIKEEEELLPNQPSKKDLEMIRKLKALYLAGDEEGFKEVIEKINRVRRSEGLDNLTPNEVISRTMKKDIIKKQKSSKPEKPKRVKKEKDRLIFPDNPITKDRLNPWYDRVVKIFGKDKIENYLSSKKTTLHMQKAILDSKKVYILYDRTGWDTRQGANNEVLSVKTSLPYKIKGNEVMFPDIGKKIIREGEKLPKIKKL